METISVNVYSFNELSPTAKSRAKSRFASVNGFSGADEYRDSLKALAEHFGGKLVDWELDWFNCSFSTAKFEVPEEAMSREEIGERLSRLGTYNPDTLKGCGDCALTGWGSDDDAIDGFRAAFFAGESDLNALLQAAFKTWLKAGQEECEAYYSDEVFAEGADAKGLRYLENGACPPVALAEPVTAGI